MTGVRRAQKVDIKQDFSTSEAVLAMLAECGAQITENAGIVSATGHPDAVHQLRVGLRRLRSLELVFRKLPGQTELSRLSGEARWLGQVLSPLRDIETVQSIFLAPLQQSASDQSGIDLLSAMLVEQKTALLRDVRDVLCDQRAMGFLEAMQSPENVADEFVVVPIMETAPRSLDRIWQRAQARAGNIQEFTAEERHDLRKAIKGLRYAVDFLSPIYAEHDTGVFLSALRDLQEVLGELNDLTTATELIAGQSKKLAGNPAAQGRVDLVLHGIAASGQSLQTEAIESWIRLAVCKPFWAEQIN